jgi:hypothetical protein
VITLFSVLVAGAIFFAARKRNLSSLKLALQPSNRGAFITGIAAVTAAATAAFAGEGKMFFYPLIFAAFIIALYFIACQKQGEFHILFGLAILAFISFYILPQTRYNLVLMPASVALLLFCTMACYRAIFDCDGCEAPQLAVLIAFIAVFDLALLEPRLEPLIRVLFAGLVSLLYNLRTGKAPHHYVSRAYIGKIIGPAAAIFIAQCFFAVLLKNPAVF